MCIDMHKVIDVVKIQDKIEQMNLLTKQIIELSIQDKQSSMEENLRYRDSVQRRQRQLKNALISELMTLIAESRKMNLSQIDRASLDTTITRLNKKLYEATSLIIL